jgi:nitroimidazol reductase NimA-like FMN-containing flavoprotein (pyridoxamine 5'-phosphate oxidase superfamily)
MADDLRPAELHEFDRANCLAMLTTQAVGRLVLTRLGPFVAPVNYAVVQETLVFRVDEGSPAAGGAGATAVFEVDVIDEIHHAGWSVVVQGTIDDITELAATDPELWDRVQPWAPGPKNRCLRLHIEQVTGRWLRGAEQPPSTDQRAYL